MLISQHQIDFAETLNKMLNSASDMSTIVFDSVTFSIETSTNPVFEDENEMREFLTEMFDHKFKGAKIFGFGNDTEKPLHVEMKDEILTFTIKTYVDSGEY